jgi:hypothetical protein
MKSFAAHPVGVEGRRATDRYVIAVFVALGKDEAYRALGGEIASRNVPPTAWPDPIGRNKYRRS